MGACARLGRSPTLLGRKRMKQHVTRADPTAGGCVGPANKRCSPGTGSCMMPAAVLQPKLCNRPSAAGGTFGFQRCTQSSPGISSHGLQSSLNFTNLNRPSSMTGATETGLLHPASICNQPHCKCSVQSPQHTQLGMLHVPSHTAAAVV